MELGSSTSLLWFIGLLWVWVGLLIWFLFAKIFFYQRQRRVSKKAVSQSKYTTLGYVNEKIAPLLPQFPYNYKDLTFLGKWVDYIVFDWLSEWFVRDIIFLEIKSWQSRLNKNEKLLKEAIQNWRVSYKVWRI